MKKNNSSLGLFIILSCAILWGSGGVIAQVVFQSGAISLNQLSFLRMIGSACILFVLAIWKDGKNLFSIFKNPYDLFSIFLFGTAGLMAMQYSYFAAVKASNAATGTVLQYTYPILMLLFTAISTRKIPSKVQIFAILAAFVGVLLIATHGDLGNLQTSQGALFWGLFSACTYVFYTVYPVRLFKKYHLFTIFSWAFLFSALVLGLLTNTLTQPVHLSGTAWLSTLVIIIFSTLIPFIIYGKGVQILGPVKASLFVTIEPIASALLAYFVTHIQFTAMDLLGFFLILAAIEFVAFTEKKASA